MKKEVKRAFAGLLAAALTVTSVTVPANHSKVAAKQKAVSVTKSISVYVGKTRKIKVKNAPGNSKNTFKSVNKKIASVSKKGVVKGKKEGKTKIKVTVRYKSSGKSVNKHFSVRVTVKKKSKGSAVQSAIPGNSNTPVASVSAQPGSKPQNTASVVTTVQPESTPKSSSSAADTTPLPGESAKPVVTVVPSAEPEDTSEPLITAEPREQLTVIKDDNTNLLKEPEAVNRETANGGTLKIERYDNGKMRKELSSQYLIKNEMGQGINLGNTLDATLALSEKLKNEDGNPEVFETAWSEPVTTQKMIDGYKQYGINTVRIPVAWSNMVKENDDTYTINKDFMNRVEQVVNYVLNDGMYAIINIHFDYGWWSEFGQGNDWKNKALARYESYWKQIAERFKDYSDHLIFESANEEFTASAFNAEIDEYGYRKSTDTSGNSGNLSSDNAYSLTNDLNQRFMNIVRNSGGNNAYRHVLIAGYQTNISMTCDDRYKMPEDTDENKTATKESISVHYYDPWEYCGDSQNAGSWGTDAQKTAMEKALRRMTKFTDGGYGVIFGEYSVCNPLQDNVTDYLYSFQKISAEYGFLPVLWDTGMYYDRSTCNFRYKDVAELYNTVTGSKGDTSSSVNTGKVSYAPNPVSIDVLSSLNPVFSWTGKWYKNNGSNSVGDDRKFDSKGYVPGTGKVAGSSGSNGIPAPDSNIKVPTKGDSSNPFVITDSCSDYDAIEFNTWGYCFEVKADWASMKHPYIYYTFSNSDPNTVGNYQMGAVSGLGKENPLKRYQFEDSDYHVVGKAVALPLSDLSQEGEGYLYGTFGNYPTVTGIYIYDIPDAIYYSAVIK